MSLEDEINQLLRLLAKKHNSEVTLIEEWEWIGTPWSMIAIKGRDGASIEFLEIYRTTEKLILEAPLAIALVSPAVYIREYRKYKEGI